VPSQQSKSSDETRFRVTASRSQGNDDDVAERWEAADGGFIFYVKQPAPAGGRCLGSSGHDVPRNAAEMVPELLAMGAPIDIVTDQTSAHDPLMYLPVGVDFDDWVAFREKDPADFTLRAREAMARHCEAMVGFMDAGAEVFDYGNSLRAEAKLGG
jgi:hypothetical protein